MHTEQAGATSATGVNRSDRPMPLLRTWLQVVVVSMVLAALVPAGAQAASSTSRSSHVIHVPAGDVEALYQAVYDGDTPRPGVVISLAAGWYGLDPSMGPNDGRLVLGEGTTLRSSLRLVRNGDGVATGEVARGGAVLVTNSLDETPSFGPAAVTVGRGGTVSRLVMANSTASIGGIDIPETGVVGNVVVQGHSDGIRLYAPEGGASASAIVRRSVSRNNTRAGIVVVHADPATAVDDSTADLRLTKNLINANGGHGVFVFGGTTGADRTQTIVHSARNVISDNDFSGFNVSAGGASDVPDATSSDNSVRLMSRHDSISESPFGLLANAVLDSTASHTNNTLRASLVGTRFTNTDSDILTTGALGGDGPSGNRARVVAAATSPRPHELAIAVSDCTDPDVDPCDNRASILLRGT